MRLSALPLPLALGFPVLSAAPDWENEAVFLAFEGVDSAFTLWINGRKIGYSQDSPTTAEFNVTKFLQPGKNVLAGVIDPASRQQVPELARHRIDLRPAEANFINVDFGQLGLGGTNSWGAVALPKYRLPSSKSYSYSFLLSPLP